MPTHCCVPECTKKGYHEDDGSKVSYFLFPTEKTLWKKWIHAIQREEGKQFEIKTSQKSAPGISGRTISRNPWRARYT